jgi:uncharacterized LabA/DUF88 family protein
MTVKMAGVRRLAFEHQFPKYDPRAPAERLASTHGWKLLQTHFYTGIPDRTDNPFWMHFGTAKLAVIGTRGVRTFSRPLRYRNQPVPLPGGGTTTILVREEEGIDVRLALDVVRMAREDSYDVALIFSQDQDLSEAADEIKAISVQQGRWIKVACAFPFSPTVENRRGINGTAWIKIDRATYDACHHRVVSFQDEFRKLLEAHGIAYDERYVWD